MGPTGYTGPTGTRGTIIVGSVPDAAGLLTYDVTGMSIGDAVIQEDIGDLQELVQKQVISVNYESLPDIINFGNEYEFSIALGASCHFFQFNFVKN
jgi:hypothetical protein